MQRHRTAIIIALFLTWGMQGGCRSPGSYRIEADKAAYDIIAEKQRQALGAAEELSIDRPSDILRRRLLVEQDLARSGGASLGSDQLEAIPHWPEEDYPAAIYAGDGNIPVGNEGLVTLSLVQALQVGARNSFDYQSRKEDVFRAALSLDLERNDFRDIFTGEVESLISSNASGDRAVSGTENSGTVDWSRRLKSGAELSAGLAVDLANLLTMGGASSLGLKADATISIPLLRGSGKHIVAEPLTQAERDVVYAIYEFERFKRIFAVNIASSYLGVLRQLDQVDNARENYHRMIVSARRSRRLAEANRGEIIQAGRAVQNELRARNGWISAMESYEDRKDSFKNLLGLPTDAAIELDRLDLEELVAPALELMAETAEQERLAGREETPPADAPVELIPPSQAEGGPLEMDETAAIELALENRLDLRVAQGNVYDAQRTVVVRADALRAELTLLGTADVGGRRSVASATSDDAQLRTDKGIYSGLLTLDLPLERTAERNAYRNSIIDLERAVREVQKQEDQIKLFIRRELRALLEAREGLQIQVQAVMLAEKRVKGVNLFLEAGRTEIRELLDAQDDLLAAQNALTSAAINYRIAELELQRDMGLLKVDQSGLWREYSPEEIDDVEQ